MLANIFTKRIFIGSLVFFVFCVGGSLLYQWHVLEEVKREFDHLAVPEVLEPIKPKGINPFVKPVIIPALDASQEEQPSSEVQPVQPVTRTVIDTLNSDIKWKDVSERRQYNNPPPFDKLPLDLWDFEATKAAMIENINFVKENWHPFEYNREVSIADAITHNIANAARATQLGLYTPEQALELNRLRQGLLDFQGFERGHIPRLMNEGHTREEAGRIASEELLERQKHQWGGE